MTNITWLVVLGLINLLLLGVGLLVFVPRAALKLPLAKVFKNLNDNMLSLLIIIGIVGIHLLEVNIIDPQTTAWVGTDFTGAIYHIEGDAVLWFTQHWVPALVSFFVIMYIAVYSFTLWFSPAYFLLTNDKRALKTLAYGFAVIYAIALPFYLFLPITNVYTYYNISSALEQTIPTVEQFFYSTTTQNNCLPSLHVAMTILVAWSVRLTGNKKFTMFAYFCMISVIFSVIYLGIHWIIDVICGALVAVVAIVIVRYVVKEGATHD